MESVVRSAVLGVMAVMLGLAPPAAFARSTNIGIMAPAVPSLVAEVRAKGRNCMAVCENRCAGKGIGCIGMCTRKAPVCQRR
jgi:hypothetical protein